MHRRADPYVRGWSCVRAIMCHLHSARRRSSGVIDYHRHITACSAYSELCLNLTPHAGLWERRRTSPVLSFVFLSRLGGFAVDLSLEPRPEAPFPPCPCRPFVFLEQTRPPQPHPSALATYGISCRHTIGSIALGAAVCQVTTWHHPDSQSTIRRGNRATKRRICAACSVYASYIS